MAFDKTSLAPEQAEQALAKWLGKPAGLTGIRRLHGGMINSVLELRFEAPPGSAVIKVSPKLGQGAFQSEARGLRYLKEHAAFPVPDVYLVESDGETVPLAFILLGRLEGLNLGEASRLEPRCHRDIDEHMAEVLTELHSHTRETYGVVGEEPGADDWIELFGSRVRSVHEECRQKLNTETFQQAGRVIDSLDVFLAPAGRPTLVHGDIWATNVIVKKEGRRWRLSGFVDPGAQYADVEYELAYLQVFHTAGDRFFELYGRDNEIREGYELRRLVYWLNTMLIHVRTFGDAHYVRQTEQLSSILTSVLDRHGAV